MSVEAFPESTFLLDPTEVICADPDGYKTVIDPVQHIMDASKTTTQKLKVSRLSCPSPPLNSSAFDVHCR